MNNFLIYAQPICRKRNFRKEGEDMNKRILGLGLMGLMIPCSLAFTACGGVKDPATMATFTSNENVSSVTEAIVKDLTDNYYNASALGSSTKYSVENLKGKNANFKYYVEIGSVSNIDDIESITIGKTKFDEDQTFDLSIGNANYISDKCFFEEDDKIYVAAPIIAFETVNNSKIKINGTEFDFNLNEEATKSGFTNATFSAGSTNTVTARQGGGYDIVFKDAKTFLKLFYTGATANDVVLTKKVLTSNYDGINGDVSYGLTKVENETGYPLGFYPIGYSSNALTETWATWYDGASMEYQAYVIDRGIFGTTLNYKIVLPE